MRIQRSPFRINAKSHKIENRDNEARVYIYDEISYFGISAEQLVKDINEITAKTLHLHFNSPGGSVFDGTAISNAIKQHKSKTVSHIDGLAASIASVIALASDEVIMSENAFLMIHDPWSIVIGNADIMREEADLLDKVGGMISKTYMSKTGKKESEIMELMKHETWMTADEALDMGFIDSIDKIMDDEKAKATLFDLSVFANVPNALKEKRQPTPRDLEKTLRDAGCTQKQAKAILAEGLDGYQRDVEQEDLKPEKTQPKRDVKAEEQRDVEPPPKMDRVNELLTRAEVMAPSL